MGVQVNKKKKNETFTWNSPLTFHRRVLCSHLCIGTVHLGLLFTARPLIWRRADTPGFSYMKELPMKIRPLQDRILVKRLESEEKTAGGLFIPDNAKEKP